jgi:phosphoglycolate phosphatase-like HAD superfamily hydrolase
MFDFDGTLVDTMGGFADIAADVIHRLFGLDRAFARAEYLRTSGLPFRQQLEVICPGDDRNDLASDQFEARKQEGFFAEHFDDDVKLAIAGLHQKGLRVIVSSNNFQELVDQFVARESDVSFDMVLGARSNFFKGADHFRHVMEVLGLAADELLFVGDSLNDGLKALENHVRFIGRTGTFTAVDFTRTFPGVLTVDRLTSLLDVIE